MKWLLLVLALCVFASPSSAYTGSFAVMDPIPGGPAHTTVTNFALDTRTTNPQFLLTDLDYVYSVSVQTGSGQVGPFLIKEESGSDPAFSFTVPQKINDDLVQAVITIWAPDTPTLSITHVHKGTPVVVEASKVGDGQADASGNVLWQFTVTSFSEFYVGEYQRRGRGDPTIPLVVIVVFSLSACVLFSDNLFKPIE